MVETGVDLVADHVVIGAGASGLAFVDALVAADPDTDVIIVDRRHAAGGHWVDAYPFVRLHQPSASYGVNSLALGEGRIETEGVNAGFFEQASAAELVRYYERVKDQLIATGRVRFLLGHDYQGFDGRDHLVRSRVSGAATSVRARRRFVDATYVESVIPARHTPSFAVDPGVRFVTPNDLVRLDTPAGGFVVLGGGKTAMDVIVWLIEQGVDPDRLQWVRPRDGWFVNRTYTQPGHLVINMLDMHARSVEAAALATSGLDYAHRLEVHEMMFRLDSTREPEVFRGATLARAELDILRSVERVVRLGRVGRIRRHQIELTDGALRIDAEAIVVDCTAQGLATRARQPIFAPGHITVQFTTLGVAPWSAAILGFVTSLDIDDAERNRLCPAVPRTGMIADQLWVSHIGFGAERARRDQPEFSAWAAGARLNPMGSLSRNRDDEAMAPLFARLEEFSDRARVNLARYAR